MPRPKDNVRIQALLQLVGVSVAGVVRQFHCHRNTIYYNKTPTTLPSEWSMRSARQKGTTARQDRHFTLTHLRHWFK